MKQNITESMFRDEWAKWDDRKDSFSYYGLGALYDWLIELEDGSHFETELDVVALDCEFSEYETALEAASEYGYQVDKVDANSGKDDDDIETEALEWLEERTQVIVFNEKNEFMSGPTSGVIINTSF